jgi:hypothetical protein
MTLHKVIIRNNDDNSINYQLVVSQPRISSIVSIDRLFWS